MNHHNKRDIQSLKSKIAEIRHYNTSLFASLYNLFNVDTKGIYITLAPTSITISHNFEYTKHDLKNILKISNTHFSKASIVLCNNITVVSNIHQTAANWQEMAHNNEYTPTFSETQPHHPPADYKTTIELTNLTFDITDEFILNIKRFFISHDQNNTHNIYITYDIPEYNKSDIIKSHIDPLQYDKTYYKFHYSVYTNESGEQSYIKCHQTGVTTTIREKQTKHYKSYFLNKPDGNPNYTTSGKTHLYDIRVSLLNNILIEAENEIYGTGRKGVYFYRRGIALNYTPLDCCLSDYKAPSQGNGVRIRVDLIANLDKEFGIKSIKQVHENTYAQLQQTIKQPIAFACYTAHMKYEYITKNTKQITLDDVREITEITRGILNSTREYSTMYALRHSTVYNKIDGDTDVKLDLDYTKEDKKPDRQKKVFQQLNMLKYADLPDNVLDTFEEIIGLYGL